MNKVFLIGRLCKDSEIRYTQTNIACATFDIAINNGKDSEGNERKADFIRVVVWGNQAENLTKYTHKGSQISVEGSIKTDSYDDNNGNKKYRTYVLGKRIMFLDNKKIEEPLPQEPDHLNKTSFTTEEIDNYPVEINNSDLPF